MFGDERRAGGAEICYSLKIPEEGVTGGKIRVPFWSDLDQCRP